MKTPKYIVIHHTAVSRKKNPDQWAATNNYHRKLWGFKSSLGYYGGYNYEIGAKGNVTQFRKDGETTAAQYQKRMNDGRAISICLDDNFDIEDPTKKQMKACRDLILEKIKLYQIKPKNVIKHRDLAKYKSCPGVRIPDDVFEYFVPQPSGVNSVTIKLLKEKGGEKIFLVDKKGKYHWIEDEPTFKALFGSFAGITWEEGRHPQQSQLGPSIKW